MSITTAPVKILSRKSIAAPSKAVAKPRRASVRSVFEQTALAKVTPDYFNPGKKQKCIIANINIGWGNALYLRGDGGGLSWDIGVPMTCIADEDWAWSYPEDNAPREIKFLRNDTDWAAGENHLILIEDFAIFMPQFP